MAQPADHNTLCCSTESISCAPLLRMKSEANTYSVLPQLASEQITFQKRNIHRLGACACRARAAALARPSLAVHASRGVLVLRLALAQRPTNTQVTGDVSGWTAMTQALGMCVSRGAFLTWSAGSPHVVCAETRQVNSGHVKILFATQAPL
jgi:hypothetical protein